MTDEDAYYTYGYQTSGGVGYLVFLILCLGVIYAAA